MPTEVLKRAGADQYAPNVCLQLDDRKRQWTHSNCVESTLFFLLIPALKAHIVIEYGNVIKEPEKKAL